MVVQVLKGLNSFCCLGTAYLVQQRHNCLVVTDRLLIRIRYQVPTPSHTLADFLGTNFPL